MDPDISDFDRYEEELIRFTSTLDLMQTCYDYTDAKVVTGTDETVDKDAADDDGPLYHAEVMMRPGKTLKWKALPP